MLFVQYGTSFSIENAKFWPVLTIFGYFVANLCTFWCPFYRPKYCGGAPKLMYTRYARMIFFKRSKQSRWTVHNDFVCK